MYYYFNEAKTIHEETGYPLWAIRTCLKLYDNDIDLTLKKLQNVFNKINGSIYNKNDNKILELKIYQQIFKIENYLENINISTIPRKTLYLDLFNMIQELKTMLIKIDIYNIGEK